MGLTVFLCHQLLILHYSVLWAFLTIAQKIIVTHALYGSEGNKNL